jgi:hypothetical protein
MSNWQQHLSWSQATVAFFCLWLVAGFLVARFITWAVARG